MIHFNHTSCALEDYGKKNWRKMKMKNESIQTSLTDTKYYVNNIELKLYTVFTHKK